MRHHEICDLIPEMSQAQYEVLRDDIKARGLLNEIVLYEGAILDGKHRHRACLDLNVKPRFRQYEGDDPAGFVFSANVAHRHLEKGQLAMVGAKLKGYFAAKARERMLEGTNQHSPPVNLPEGKSGDARDQAAFKVGVSGKSVDMAEHIMKKGVPKLVKMVEQGALSLNKGLAIANMTKERQAVVVDMPTAKSMSVAIGKTARASEVKKRSAPSNKDGVPGTPLVRVLLSRLEIITNEIANHHLTPSEFSKRFVSEFDWNEPLLVRRLGHAQAAIQAISELAVMGEQARRNAA